jgi:hypothetical protein
MFSYRFYFMHVSNIKTSMFKDLVADLTQDYKCRLVVIYGSYEYTYKIYYNCTSVFF